MNYKILSGIAIISSFILSITLVGTNRDFNAFQTYSSDSSVWSHYEGAASSCGKGIKEYWVNCSTHIHQFEAPLSYSRIDEMGVPSNSFINSLEEDDDRLIKSNHDFDTDCRCKKCGRTDVLKYTNVLVSKDDLTLTEKAAPAGFANVYHYAKEVGGGENSNTLFSSNLSLEAINRFQYAVKCEANKTYYVHSCTAATAGGGSYQIPGTTVDTWVTVTALKNSDGSWSVSNDLGNFVGKDSNTFVVNPDGLRVNKVFIPRFQPAENPGFDITEILADYGATKHVHTFDANNVCTKCNMKILPFVGENSILRNPSSATLTDNVGSYNFQNMYYISESAGGGAGSNCFVKHTVEFPTDITHIEFAMSYNSSISARIYVKTTSDGSASQISFPDIHWAHKNNTVRITMDKIADGQWTVANEYKNFGNSLKSFTAYTNSYLWTLLRPLTNSSFYISEILAK